jgi:hypothetical protein
MTVEVSAVEAGVVVVGIVAGLLKLIGVVKKKRLNRTTTPVTVESITPNSDSPTSSKETEKHDS